MMGTFLAIVVIVVIWSCVAILLYYSEKGWSEQIEKEIEQEEKARQLWSHIDKKRS